MSTEILEAGWLCTIIRRTADDGQPRAFCGQVQAVDTFGVRITGMDWLIGTPANFDIVVPWSEVQGVFDICTEGHSDEQWGRTAAATQRRASRDQHTPTDSASNEPSPNP